MVLFITLLPLLHCLFITYKLDFWILNFENNLKWGVLLSWHCSMITDYRCQKMGNVRLRVLKYNFCAMCQLFEQRVSFDHAFLRLFREINCSSFKFLIWKMCYNVTFRLLDILWKVWKVWSIATKQHCKAYRIDFYRAPFGLTASTFYLHFM